MLRTAALGQQQPASSLSPGWLFSSAYRPLMRINHERRLPANSGHQFFVKKRAATSAVYTEIPIYSSEGVLDSPTPGRDFRKSQIVRAAVTNATKTPMN